MDSALKLLDLVPGWVWTILLTIVTTVIIEYAAKPRLDARKARLLRDRAQLDEVVFAMQSIGLRAGSLLPVPTGTDPFRFAVYTEQVKKLVDALGSAQDVLGRLSHRYVTQHRTHIRRTAYFLGYLEGVARSTLQGQAGGDAALRQAAEEVEAFDVYFLVYVGLQDSAENPFKRLFWRRFTRRQYAERSLEVARSHGYSGS